MTNFYPTASTVAVFLNGYHIDQAFRIDYKESSYKIPIYGYNDIEYTKAVQSKVMVQGMLVTNFMFAGYLTEAIIDRGRSIAYDPRLFNYTIGNSIKKDTDSVTVEKTIRQQLFTELPPNNTLEEKASRAEYIANLISDPSIRRQTKEALSKFFHTKKEDPQYIPIGTTPFDGPLVNSRDIYQKESALKLDGQFPFGSTIDIYYHSPEYSTWFLRFKNVYFNDITQQINQAGAAGSAENLFEIYSFIAAKRELVLL